MTNCSQPGANEVIISGLDPSIDPDSVRVEGYGLATITDIRAETVPRAQQFQDQYPNLVDDDDDDNEDSTPLPGEDYGVDKTPVEHARQELQSAQAYLAKFRNSQETAVKMLSFLDSYGANMKAQEVDINKLTDFLSVYESQRASASESHEQAFAEIARWTEKVNIAREKRTRAEAAFQKAKDAASREIRREQEKKEREKVQKRLQKQRLIEQRRKFWTDEISRVVVNLDRATAFTPSSSRRQSLTSVTDTSVDTIPSKPLDEDCVNLRLTYVVPNARWAPRYELKISTPKSSAELVYRAEFENNTSETWENAKITFSTSQTFFSGLDEKIPIMEPWHIKLGSASGVAVKGGISTSSIQSKREIMANTTITTNTGNIARHTATGKKKLRSAPGTNPESLFALNTSLADMQGTVPLNQLRQARTSMAMRRMAPSARAEAAEDPIEDDDSEDDCGFAAPDLSPETHSITHQDSVRQDYGLTTTYDLPGQRTLEPSTVKRRHVIAELHMTSVTLSHVLIPKLRRAAFLKARITNTTSVSLLRGKAGMTVDGTFLGSTTLPGCEPGHFIDLSLGVDPSVLVTYANPTARRATTGFFSKEDSAVFSRSCWIKNTKKSEVSITVIDQVPVSEDEHLRIHILEPKGLETENDRAKLNGLFKDGENGSGEVVLEKNGQIRWNIKLRPGKDVRLGLEYESRIPSGQQIVGLD